MCAPMFSAVAPQGYRHRPLHLGDACLSGFGSGQQSRGGLRGCGGIVQPGFMGAGRYGVQGVFQKASRAHVGGARSLRVGTVLLQHETVRPGGQ